MKTQVIPDDGSFADAIYKRLQMSHPMLVGIRQWAKIELNLILTENAFPNKHILFTVSIAVILPDGSTHTKVDGVKYSFDPYLKDFAKDGNLLTQETLKRTTAYLAVSIADEFIPTMLIFREALRGSDMGSHYDSIDQTLKEMAKSAFDVHGDTKAKVTLANGPVMFNETYWWSRVMEEQRANPGG